MSRFSAFLPGLTAVAAMALAAPAHADTDYSWSAFGSVGAGRVNRPDLMFQDRPGKDLQFNGDSMIAGQFNAASTTGFGFTSQVVARSYDAGKPDEEYKPHTEWFFGSWQHGNDFRVRVGRLRTPFFAYSESLEVGYSYPWVRPPSEMYAPLFAEVSHLDGANVDVYGTLAGFDTTVQVGVGRTKTSHAGYDVRFDPFDNITFSAVRDDLKLRYSLVYVKQSVTSPDSVLAANFYRFFGATDPIFNDIANTLTAENETAYFHSMGISKAFGDYTVESEYYYSPPRHDQISVKSQGGYLSISRQINKWTPYVVYGAYLNQVDPQILHRIDASEAVLSGPGINFLRAKTREGLLYLHSHQQSLTFGTRYDLSSHIDVKAEYGFYRLHQPNNGQFYDVDPDHARIHQSAQTLSLVLDWVL